LRRGDLILRINGEPARSWQDVSLALLTSPDKPVALEVRRGDRVFPVTVVPKRVPRDEVGDAGIFPVIRPQISEVLAGKPAAGAGLRAGDEVRAVDGRPITETQDFIAAIKKRPGRRVSIEVVRDGKPMTFTMVTAVEGGEGKIGVSLGFFQRYPLGRALRESVRLNVQIVRETFQVLGKVFRREMPAKGALAGPIEIAGQTGAAVRADFKNLFYIMGFLSLSIAILNLMPIPILDGGQIVILLVEGVIRRDLSMRVKEVISQVGLVLILMLMAVVIWFDLSKNLPPGFLPGS
jgi:regulator of sigma E protease